MISPVAEDEYECTCSALLDTLRRIMSFGLQKKKKKDSNFTENFNGVKIFLVLFVCIYKLNLFNICHYLLKNTCIIKAEFANNPGANNLCH